MWLARSAAGVEQAAVIVALSRGLFSGLNLQPKRRNVNPGNLRKVYRLRCPFHGPAEF
jgi:hypothetical protein